MSLQSAFNIHFQAIFGLIRCIYDHVTIIVRSISNGSYFIIMCSLIIGNRIFIEYLKTYEKNILRNNIFKTRIYIRKELLMIYSSVSMSVFSDECR